MNIVVAPVLTREGGDAFDAWTPEDGLSRGYIYRCIDDAYYARKFESGPELEEMPAIPSPAALSMNSCSRRSESRAGSSVAR
jgi:hypothetical protein